MYHHDSKEQFMFDLVIIPIKFVLSIGMFYFCNSMLAYSIDYSIFCGFLCFYVLIFLQSSNITTISATVMAIALGVTGISGVFGLGFNAVSNWINRSADFMF